MSEAYNHHVSHVTPSQYERDPQHMRARAMVNNEIRRGRLEPAEKHPCHDCGAKASQYDHHKGYADDNALDVQPVCDSCHVRRTVQRA